MHNKRNSKIAMMTSPTPQHESELHSALQAARENENRWLEMHGEYAIDSESMEQWAATAKLRRLEVERIEALLPEQKRA